MTGSSTETDSQLILVERSHDVIEVTLNRPQRKNALIPESMERLAEVFTRLGDARAVLVRGADDFFCSGLDLKEIDPGKPRSSAWADAHRALAAVDAPVVAALAGGAINAGAALALACDLIVVGSGAFLQIKEAEMGLTPPVNAAWLALRYPPSVGLQLALSCRRFYGPDLMRLGVAMEVTDDHLVLPRARELARTLAAYPDHGAERTKRALRESRGDTDRFSACLERAIAVRSAS